MAGLDWLSARPVAHRGLHDAAAGIVENTSSAFSAAIAGNYAIECDLQLSADGEAVVFHDATLERLMQASGPLASFTAAQLRQMTPRTGSDRIVTLDELCELVAGRVTLLLELKSPFTGDTRLAVRVAAVVQNYAGPVAAMSFDPDMVAALARAAPGLPRGIVAQRRYDRSSWPALGDRHRRTMHYMLHALRTRPHFIAYRVNDLPAFAPLLARHLFGLPLLTWTVRSQEEGKRARRWANQIIFEGFRP